jgi:replicative DNA helicase
MALAYSNVRKLPAEPTPLYRAAPHNIEAEQALLGAILVNNEAFYRVSDFLEPRHFFEPCAPARLRARSRSRPSCPRMPMSAG